MKNSLLLKLTIPLVFGVFAAFFHFRSTKVQNSYYLKSATEIPIGSELSIGESSNLTSFSVPASTPLGTEFVKYNDAALVRGMTVNRLIPKDTPILRSDLELRGGVEPAAGHVALNISLQAITFEPKFLVVGENVRFVFEDNDADLNSSSTYRLSENFKLLAIGDQTTISQTIDEQRPSTISVEVSEDLTGDVKTQNLLRIMQEDRVVAIAFPGSQRNSN